MIRLLLPVVMMLLISCTDLAAQSLVLTANGKCRLPVVVPNEATRTEATAARVLQDYIGRISGCRPDIVKEAQHQGRGIFLGNTERASVPRSLKDESFVIRADADALVICGRNGRGTLYGVYALLEEYLGCRKPGTGAAVLPRNKNISLPAIDITSQPAFAYRQVYFPMELDEEYLAWHRLHRLDDLFGLWGHSLPKLMPAGQYFKAHPEYFAQVQGRRSEEQLCLSHPQVYSTVLAALKKRIADNEDALYWSVAPGDASIYCTCPACERINRQEGSPSGVLLRFVNKIAANWPDKKFTTLAYLHTIKPPKATKPAPNVYIFLSSVDAYRSKPLADEPSAAAFRKYLLQWAALTPNIFVWDYATQFTNYLAPFPDMHTIVANMQYLQQQGVKGVFVNGSGEHPSSFDALKSYLYARALWNTGVNAGTEAKEFMEAWYGAAAPQIIAYARLLTQNMKQSRAVLDIYGNPVGAHNTWLTPAMLRSYNALLDKAASAVKSDASLSKRVAALQLSLEYVALQQARYYGVAPGGIYTAAGGGYRLAGDLPQRVRRFVAAAKEQGVKELAEGGMSPDAYMAEWQRIFTKGYTPNAALNAPVALVHPAAEDYAPRGARTLTDGVTGYADYSYNWLHFYGVPMEAMIDLGSSKNVSQVSLRFLHDTRHHIYAATKVVVQVSPDGHRFVEAKVAPGAEDELGGGITAKGHTAPLPPGSYRYIKVEASYAQPPATPEHKQPVIACDEIYVR